MRWGRVLVIASLLGPALVGALVAPWQVTLVHGPTLGLLLGGTLALADGGFPREAASRRLVLRAAGAGILLVPFGAALPVLGSLGGLVVLVLLVVGSLVAADRLAEDAAAEVGAAAGVADVLPVLPTAELADRWVETEEILRSGQHRDRVVEVRALLLDELSRRDPEGVAAWVAAGGRSPRPYLRADRDGAG
ncbi:hypothetical protein ACI79P_10260 [Blastococcus sp. SYSU DS0510]